MSLKQVDFRRVAIAALIGMTVPITMTHGAETPSSPAEQWATAHLNRDISAANAATDERYKLLEEQYQQQKRQNDDLLAQYRAQNEVLQQQYQDIQMQYMSLEAQYTQQKTENDELRQQIEELQKRYQEILGNR